MVETTLKTLIERFRSKPDWQHPDPAVRTEAVLRLPSAEKDLLLAIAREDGDPRVRRAATRKVTDVSALAAVAASDADPGVREEAESRLAHLAVHEPHEEAARAAVAALHEAKHLAAVAKSSPRPAVREAAIRALADPRVLAAIVRESEDSATRLLALSRIDDPPTLVALAQKTEQKAIAVAAVDRLVDAQALRSVAEKARVGAAARRARAKLEPPAAQAAQAVPAAVEPVAAGDDEAEREAYERAREAHERAASERALALAGRTRLAEAIESAEGEAIPLALARAREEWAGCAPPAGAEAEALDGRIRNGLEAAAARHTAYLAGLAKREELEALTRQAEELAATDLKAAGPAFTALEARWAEATTGADLPELRARFRAAAESLRSRRQAARQEAAQKDQERLQQLERLTRRAEAIAAKGAGASLRDADHTLREAREALEHPGHFPSRKDRDAVLARLEAARRQLYPLVQQLREDAEWKRWANVTVQEELCVRAEALLAEPDAEKAAHELRELDARWKLAKEAPKDEAEALWTRFKAAREQLKGRTDAFFAQQAEELAGNLKKKEALCEKAEALAGSSDWLRTAEALRQLQAEWKAVGPVPRAGSQRVWERFRKPCDAFFTRWQEHRNLRSHEWTDNLAKKEALCEKAEALAESSDWEAAAAEVKRLQADWRTIGAVKKSRSDAVWNRFRSACDRFFDRYKNRDEHARQAARSAREAVCSDLLALLPAGDGEPGSPPPDLVARLLAAQAAWRQAGPLPHDELAALELRFAEARDRVLSTFPAAFQGTDLDPEANRRKAERLAARAEALLEELSAAAAPQARTAVELAARLRDALATNTIGGKAAVEDKWNAAATEMDTLQSAWRRLGPIPGGEGKSLAERFEAAGRRFAAQRPKSERPRGEAPRGDMSRPRRDEPRRGRGSRPGPA